MNIVISGYIASYPVAGFFWHYVNYVLGFQALGHDVWYVEDSGDSVWGWDTEHNCPDPTLKSGVAFLNREMAEVGLAGRWAVRVIPQSKTFGLTDAEVQDVLAHADLLVNVSCVTPPRTEYMRIPIRVAVDTDPVFTQIRIARGDPRRAWIPDFHTHLFTFGVPPLPASEHEWLPTRQPVVLNAWPVGPAPDITAAFSTVASWQAYPAETWRETVYAGKDVSFRPLLVLPMLTSAPLVVALGGGGDVEAARSVLATAGWSSVDGIGTSASSASYRRYIESSLGEIGVAKHGYVVARSGWFSERTCCYLASGRPAVVQETGMSEWLPTHEGLLTFTTATQAAAAIEEVRSEPQRHAVAARRVVEEHFDAQRVCTDLLNRL